MNINDPQPVEELVADLSRRLHKMVMEASADIEREQERSRQWCNDRWRRMENESRAMSMQRDALLKAWSAGQIISPVIVPPTT